MALACRMCRTLVTAHGGCALCAEFKTNLTDTDEDIENTPSLSELSNEALQVLRLLIKRSKDNLKSGIKAEFELGTTLALNASSSMAKMLESARKLQLDGVAVIKSMSFMERLELFADWYMALPPGQRSRLMDHLQKLEKARALPAGKKDDDD